MLTKNQFDNKAREFAKCVQEFLGGTEHIGMTYFTKMPQGWRISFMESSRGISIELWHDKSLEV